MEKEQINKLQKLCVPIAEFLKINANPYASVIITEDRARVTVDEAGIPMKKESDQ